MKVLIIEDDEYKAKQLESLLIANNVVRDRSDLCLKRAFQSGMEEICLFAYDLILLDMSMPSYEDSHKRSSGRHRDFGGREILHEMKRKNIQIPTIVVTQFNIFGEGYEIMDEIQLDEILQRDYSDVYLGMVYYNTSRRNWMEKLLTIINEKVIGEK